MLLAAGGAATAESVTPDSFADCPAGNACFYNDLGQKCTWSDADPDWSSGSIRCSWARTRQAVFVTNHGTSPAFTAVAFYQGTNYTSYNGCMGQGWEGRIGPVFLLSHRWITTPC
ncbi:hypothetical protein JOF56_005098 [Kibdelosporangium banguiense]|uniref:Peptidase inhibitor family I36 n=1 Tax=Kibdelosporangium banguiense TaxID=1365924 RepID=A0ABS4TLD1_9PSEU|nr:hypothetical protein [Kibdelosporangium banguiense]MBP2324713.1 hypothetical protein [Kibdelosporangium banguiense]